MSNSSCEVLLILLLAPTLLVGCSDKCVRNSDCASNATCGGGYCVVETVDTGATSDGSSMADSAGGDSSTDDGGSPDSGADSGVLDAMPDTTSDTGAPADAAMDAATDAPADGG